MRKNRVPKSVAQKLFDLDEHLYLLRENLKGLKGNSAHIKVISAELRTLVCHSSNTEGLLWRLVDELKINDRIFLHAPGKLIRDHPLARGLQFATIPIQRGGKGDPRLPPDHLSLKEIIKDGEAVVIRGEPLIHEYLIKAISQQMGTAHECDGLELSLVALKSIFINGTEPFVPILVTDSEFTLEIGDRVLQHAENELRFKRKLHKVNYGEVSVVVRLRSKQLLVGRIPLIIFRSYISGVDIECVAGPRGISFNTKKNGKDVTEFLCEYPENWKPGEEAVFVFSYSSNAREARTITNTIINNGSHSCDLGWLHATDIVLEQNNVEYNDFIEKRFLLIYERLLSRRDTQELIDLNPNDFSSWKANADVSENGVFPD